MHRYFPPSHLAFCVFGYICHTPQTASHDAFTNGHPPIFHTAFTPLCIHYSMTTRFPPSIDYGDSPYSTRCPPWCYSPYSILYPAWSDSPYSTFYPPDYQQSPVKPQPQ
ncbi:hypothetical protein EGW08_011384 [Elysia chlorotica]|uniref:Uncharacterized protein n=1 Tax=Elysia chlorotica TaxID=188477 RepID=A0A3S1BCL2_ELYCH|nr:hypothetical protein EGW08_011384 [Elysia chlorotica]